MNKLKCGWNRVAKNTRKDKCVIKVNPKIEECIKCTGKKKCAEYIGIKELERTRILKLIKEKAYRSKAMEILERGMLLSNPQRINKIFRDYQLDKIAEALKKFESVGIEQALMRIVTFTNDERAVLPVVDCILKLEDHPDVEKQNVLNLIEKIAADTRDYEVVSNATEDVLHSDIHKLMAEHNAKIRKAKQTHFEE